MIKQCFELTPAARAVVGIALVASALHSGVAMAASGTLASGSSSLTNVSYELINLAPTSGQTPWIKFGTDAVPLTGALDATGLSEDPAAAGANRETQAGG